MDLTNPPSDRHGAPPSDRHDAEVAAAVDATFILEHARVLLDALHQARAGSLTSTWRIDLPRKATGHDSLAARALDRVAESISTMPPQDWEPGVAPNWRQAIDAWYSAAQELLAGRFADYLDEHAHVLRSTAAGLKPLMPDVEPQHPEGDNPWAVVAGRFQLIRDDELHFATIHYVNERDWLTASYIAGLTAGGVAGLDWRAWLSERATHRSFDKHFVNQVHAETKKRRGRHALDLPLPAYWTGADWSASPEPVTPQPKLRILRLQD
jgi:hypothetical protein